MNTWINTESSKCSVQVILPSKSHLMHRVKLGVDLDNKYVAIKQYKHETSTL